MTSIVPDPVSPQTSRGVMTDRRKFLAKASGGVATLATAAIADAPNVIAQPKIQWRMPTTFPAALDIQFAAAQRLAKAVDEMSGGRFKFPRFLMSANTTPGARAASWPRPTARKTSTAPHTTRCARESPV